VYVRKPPPREFTGAQTLVIVAIVVGAVGLQAVRHELPVSLGEREQPSHEPGEPSAGSPVGSGVLTGSSGRGAVTSSAVSRSPRIEGIGVAGWHNRAVRNRREINRLRAIILGDGNVVEAINLAAATYGNGSALWRKARCETGGTYSRHARNTSSGAAGLFQFLPSTWASTPYRVFSPFSAYANALAAGWMHTHGRGGEWECP